MAGKGSPKRLGFTFLIFYGKRSAEKSPVRVQRAVGLGMETGASACCTPAQGLLEGAHQLAVLGILSHPVVALGAPASALVKSVQGCPAAPHTGSSGRFHGQ